MSVKKSAANLFSGILYSVSYNDEVTHENLVRVFKEAKKLSLVTQDYIEVNKLNRGNIFNNDKALPSQQNEILIFELDFGNKELYNSNFRGFLYPDGTINGKFKYSVDAKILDQSFNGIYQFIKNGNLIIFGKWNSQNIEGTIFIEFIKARKPPTFSKKKK